MGEVFRARDTKLGRNVGLEVLPDHFSGDRNRFARFENDTRSPTPSALTAARSVVGTVADMSPEQARGLPVDHRSDASSLGTVLSEMLAWRRPFGGDTPADTLTAIIRDEPEPLDALAREARPGPGT